MNCFQHAVEACCTKSICPLQLAAERGGSSEQDEKRVVMQVWHYFLLFSIRGWCCCGRISLANFVMAWAQQ
jgi:hypothetical protein